MSENNPIDENKLDELLREFYLEENSTNFNENEARHVFEQEYSVNIDAVKEQNLLNKLKSKKNGFWNWNGFLLIVAIVILSIVTLYFLFNSSSENKSNPISDKTDDAKKENEISTNSLISEESEIMTENGNYSIVVKSDTFAKDKIVKVSPITRDSILAVNLSTNSLPPQEKYIKKTMPVLSETDRKQYSLVKEQIIKRLFQSDKELYSHIPASKLSYSGKSVEVDAFTVRNVAITNLEFKTFLADLISQKREEDYFKAQVSPEQWISFGCYDLANTYFQDDKYNDFPVVNISLDGAMLFCKWMEDEVNAYSRFRNPKSKLLKIRLPFDEEWLHMARNGYARIAYEKGYNTIYDETEGFIDPSFSGRVETIKKRAKRTDTLYLVLIPNKYRWEETKLLDFYKKAEQYYESPSIDTINDESMKIIGKIGRVSEMTIQKKPSRVWLTGQTWESKEDYLKLENEFKTNLSSPFVGFRPVIINPDDPEYKNPFW